MVHLLSRQSSILNNWIAEIRSVTIQTDRMRFRKNMERLGEVAAYEISKTFSTHAQTISTPMGELEIEVINEEPVVATILRAGIPLHQGIMNYFDKADAAFIAAYRKYHRDGSFEIAQNYLTAPPIVNRPLIIADPMLATGASLALAISSLQQNGLASELHVVCVIASSIGIEMISRKFPAVHIWTGAIDDELTARGYIVPGLGDAGDLSYGSKTQN